MADNPLLSAWDDDQRRRGAAPRKATGNPLLDEWDRQNSGTSEEAKPSGIVDTVLDKVSDAASFLAESMGINFASRDWREERARTGRSQLDASVNEGFLDRAGSLLERGAAAADSGFATTVGAVTGSQRQMQKAREQRAIGNMPVAGSTSWADVKARPTPGTIGNFILDTTAESIPLMAATAAPYVGIPAVAASGTGSIAQNRADANGGGDPTVKDVAIAAPFGIGSAVLERTGLMGILEAPGKSAVSRVARAGGKEALTEGAQSALEYTGGSLGTDQGFNLVDLFDNVVGGAVGGAGMGGGIRGGMEVADAGGRVVASRVTGRPIPKGVREQAAEAAVPLSPEDAASPLPTGLIAEGKSVVADVDASSAASGILGQVGLPSVGQRVQIRYPDGRTQSGVMADAFTDPEFDNAPGVKINLDGGGTLDEHVATLNDAGVTIAPLSIEDLNAAADAIDAQLAQKAAEAQVPEAAPAPIDVGAPTAPAQGGFKVADSGKIAPVSNAKAVAQQIFPGARVTSWKRAAGAAGNAGAKSWHARSGAAVDMAPIEGMTFDQAVQRYRDAGYSIIEAIDETNPATMKKTGATGPHWHFVLGTGGTPMEGGARGGAINVATEADPFAADSAQREGFKGADVAEVQLPEPGADLRGEPIDKEWHRFTPESGTLGVPRAQMPQIAAEKRGAMVNFLNARGVSHSNETVAASSLKPTQAEFSADKVLKARDFTGGDRAILVSSDDHVIDGHHQWLAKRDAGEDVRVIRLGATAKELLDIVPEFPSATIDEGAAPAAQPEATGAETAQVDLPTAPAVEQSASPVWSISDTSGGKSVAIKGATGTQMAAITQAVPQIMRLIRADGASVYPKRYEAAIREALDAFDRKADAPAPAVAKPKKTKTAKPTDAFKFLARAGGITDTEGHDLSDRFGIDATTSRVAPSDRGKKKWRQAREMSTRRQSVFVPGAGPLVREGGMSIDRAGELLHEAGYLSGEDGGRPTVADTIAYLERGMEGSATLSKMLPLDQLSEADAYTLPDNFEDMRTQMFEWANYQGADLTSDDVDKLARLMLRDDVENEDQALAMLVNEAVMDALEDMSYEVGDYEDALAQYDNDVDPSESGERSAPDARDAPESSTSAPPVDDPSVSQDSLAEPAKPSVQDIADEFEGATDEVAPIPVSAATMDMLREDPNLKKAVRAELAKRREASGDGDLLGGPTRDEERQALERRGEGRKSNGVDQRPAGSDGGLFDPAARDQASMFDQQQPSRIEDFGETLDGARKHYAAAYKDRMASAADVDISAEPLSKSWPDPDYQKLLADGTDPYVVATIRAMRDEVPNKPQKGWKLKGWVDTVKELRAYANALVDGTDDGASVRTFLTNAEGRRVVADLQGRIDLYQALGHEKSLKGVSLRYHEYSLYRGEKFDPPLGLWSVEQKAKATAYSNWPRELATGKTREEAIENFKAKLATLNEQPSPKLTKFDIYSRRGTPGFIVGKKIGKTYADLKTFDTAKEAREYVRENHDELVKMLESFKDVPDVRRPSNSPRVGENHRDGADVSPQQFAEAFGFRGVQFGNYVEDARRREDLNEAYDALMDMAGVLGVPPKALSLNGELGLAFGARGKGGKGAAAAHYEKGNVVINLTKRGGAGSLAHEWWHALDNYFSRSGGRGDSYMTGGSSAQIRDAMADAFRGVNAAIRQTAIKKRSESLDQRRSKPYWSTDIEMSARSFESYIIAKLADNEFTNDYLANVVSENAFAIEGGYPYPTAAEIPAIRAGFDALFQTVEANEADGRVALQSRLEDREPVASLTGDELGVDYRGPDDMPALRTAALSYYKRELLGTTVKMADGVPASFTGRGLRKSTSLKGDILLRLVPAIPSILEKGEITWSGPGDRPDISKRIEVAARVELGDRSYNVFVIVREHSDSRRRQYDLTFDNGYRGASEGAEGRSSLIDGDVSRRNSDPDKKSPSAELNLRLVESESNAGTDATVEAARADLQQRLADYGIADRVALTVGNAILPPRVAGEFVAAPGVGRFISVALDTSPDARFTLDHEAVHAARNMGLFLPAEWRSLEAAARADRAMMGSVRKRYPHLNEEQQVEEAVADRFARWQGGDKERGFVAKAFERVRNVLRAVGEALRGGGFTTADSVMRALAGGEIGAREGGIGVDPADLKRLVRKVDTAAFRNWFGDSKVVDENGDPLIMYHGTSRAGRDGDAFEMFDTYASNYGLMGMGGYFTADPDVASSYTAKGRGENPTVYPVFLSIKNPIDMDAVADPAAWESGFEGVSEYHEGGDTNEAWYRAAEDMTRDEGFSRWEGAEVMQNGLIAMGHDGVTHMGGGRIDPDSVRHRVYIAFDPEQIKSATGNAGTFDPGNPDIRYSVVDDKVAEKRVGSARSALTRLAGKGSPFAGKMADAMDRWRTAVQDRYLPLLRTQQRIEMQLGRPLTEAENPYLGEELLTGRVGAKLENLAENMVEPLFDTMQREGVSIEELESYLYARHAPERNARIAKINPEFKNGGGSGMSDIEAAAIINRIEKAGKTDALKRVAALVDGIRDYALQERIDGGLMSADEAKAWRETYENYVPLRGKGDAGTEGEADGIRINRSSGINVKGKESRAAFGRRSRADDILAYTLLQAEEAIVRAETNRVAKRVVDLARAAPDAKFWTVDKVTRKPVMNQTTGIVRYEDQTRIQPEDAPFTVSAKFDGEEHRVTMNRDNASARRLADSLRNLTQQQLDWVTQHLGKVNRFLSAVNTSWNPEFVVTNAFRDLQAAAVNMAGIDVDGLVRKTLKDYPAALAGSMRGAFRVDKGEWGKWYREFTNEGGRVYFNNVEDLAGLKGRIEKEFARAAARQSGPKMDMLTAQRGFNAVRDFVEAANSGVENAVRLAAYKNAREAGATKAQAASIAKNLTVNFNRRGQMGPAINAAYLFFNASMQGTARILSAMKSPRVRKILAGVVVGGFLTELLNAFMSGTDDDGESYYDKISDFDKSRNIILMIPGTAGEHIKIPMPYGYNVFANAGRTLAEVYRRGGDRWQESASNFVSSVADAFNPIGGTDSILKAIAPTIIDPIVDLEQNSDYSGRPIMPEQNPFEPPAPDAQRYFGSVGPHWRAITDWLTKATGGSDVEPGAIDISPETLEHLSGVVFGAAGSFLDRNVGLVGKLATGDEVEANDFPLVRKVYGEKPGWYDKSAFFDRVNQVEQATEYAKGYIEREDWDRFDAFVGKNEQLLSLEDATKAANKQLREIRKARRENDFAREMGKVDEATWSETNDAVKAAEKDVIGQFNTVWNATMLPQSDKGAAPR